MADLTITAANVVAGGSANIESGTAAVAITAGQVVYKEAATGKYNLADADAGTGTSEARIPYGIALHAAAAGQPLQVVRSGQVTIGATLVAGTVYYLSKTAGGIAPLADVTAARIAIIGFAISTTVLDVRMINTGVNV